MRLPTIPGTSVALLLAVSLLGCHGQAPPAASAGSDTSAARTTSFAPVPVVEAAITEAAESPSPTPVESPKPSDDSSPSTNPTPTASLNELLLFVPLKIPSDQRPKTPEGIEDLRLTSTDGTSLHAWWLPHPQPVAHVLYLHGNSGNLWTVAGYLKWLHDTADCAVLSVDYRGYGLSEGRPTVEGVLKDARTARDELRQRIGAADGREVIIGRSLGGALAVDVAAEEAPRGLVLESTFASFQELARLHAGAWAAVIPPGRLDSRSRLAKYPGPLLQMHGDADRLIPFDQGVSLHQAATGPKQFVCVPGGGHNSPRSREYLAELERYLRELP